jgi:pyridoxal phosphate enzyme (YggS family)
MSVLSVSSPSTVPSASLARLQAVRERLDAACLAAQRPTDSVRLLAVSKTFSAQAVADMVSAGQTAFGENYIQEGVDKIADLAVLRAATRLVWHCIGPIQSNKTRMVAEHFDWVQSVDRLKIAERLSAQRPANLPPLQVCVQVNVDGGATKSGVQISEATALAQAIQQLPGLQLRGLMCIPDPVDSFAGQVAIFDRARNVFESWRALGLPVDTLSMGMSGDLEAAVASGATMVRVGTALFGAR